MPRRISLAAYASHSYACHLPPTSPATIGSSRLYPPHCHRTNRGRFARDALPSTFEEKTESQFLCLLILLPHILPSDHTTKDNLLAHLTTSCQNLRFPDKNHNRQRGLTPQFRLEVLFLLADEIAVGIDTID